nr:MAG TPA: TrbC/VIRB2 family [Caudoviricetes sp.]
MPQTSDIDTKELDKLQGSSGQEESGENQDDSLEQKVAKSLNRYKTWLRYTLFIVGIIIIIIFGCRYLHLINSNEKIISIYLQTADWHVYVIYGISLAFTGSIIVTVFCSLLSYLKFLSKNKN